MWIAAIQRERYQLEDGSIEDRDMLCRSVIAAAIGRQFEITCSALALVEVCKAPSEDADPGDQAVIFDFFRHSWVMMVAVNTEVGEIGRALMMHGYPGLKPADATHIASALVAEASELQTFDRRLLALDGMIAKKTGGTLPIRKPKLSGQIPLFEGGNDVPIEPARPTLPASVSAPLFTTARRAIVLGDSTDLG